MDFILGLMEVAIEAKATTHVTSDHLRGLRALIEDHPSVRTRVIVCLEPRRRTTSDGIVVLPADQFSELLRSKELLGGKDP